MRFQVEVAQAGEKVFTHEFPLRERDALFHFPVGTLSDTIGWDPHAAPFARKHGCRLTRAMAARLIPLFREAYPEISFVPIEAVDPRSRRVFARPR